MVPAGDATEAQIDELLEHLEPGDTIIDGGNTNFHDDVRRHARARGQGHPLRRCRHVGGIWGLQRLLPDGRRRRRGGRRRSSRSSRRSRPPDGYLHVGGPGAGHYVKMVHNGIEYGLMQAYAEGFEILHASEYELDLAAISELWMHGSVVRSWLLELAGRAFKANGQDLAAPQGLRRRLRRGPLDGPGGDRPRRPGAGHHALAADPLPLPPGRLATGPRCSPRCATSSAATRSRPSSDVAASRAATHGVEAPAKDPAPVEAPPDQPIPARPAPRPKDAPRTMQDLRLARQGKRAVAGQAARERPARGPAPRARPGSVR